MHQEQPRLDLVLVGDAVYVYLDPSHLSVSFPYDFPTPKAGRPTPGSRLPYRPRAAVNGITYSTLSLPYKAFLCPFPLSSRSAASVAQAAFSALYRPARTTPPPETGAL